jgi:hypothetical protein
MTAAEGWWGCMGPDIGKLLASSHVLSTYRNEMACIKQQPCGSGWHKELIGWHGCCTAATAPQKLAWCMLRPLHTPYL